MDLNNMRRVSSAGYRLPEKVPGSRPVTNQPPMERKHQAATDGAASPELKSDRTDPVKRDQVWKEMVWSERRGVQEWEKNWAFLTNYDQLGRLKPEQPLPSYVSLFSDRVPNTANQMFGSRLSTPLGSDLVRLDRLLLLSGSHHRRKQDPEMLPC